MARKNGGLFILLPSLITLLWQAPALAARRDDAAALAGCGIIMIIAIVGLIINILLLVWVSRDAKARGMGSIGWMVLVFLTGFIGLIIYLLARTKGEKIACPRCGNQRLAAMHVCPHCGNE